MLYFCIPQNDALLALWNTVDQRLFDIRHCRNIDGVERAAAAVRSADRSGVAGAGGGGRRGSGSGAERPSARPRHHNRFSAVLPRTLELSADLRSLGAAVLSVLEKQDGEELQLLRSSQEIALIELTEQVRQLQIDEATSTIAGVAGVTQDGRRALSDTISACSVSPTSAFPKRGDAFNLASIPTTLAKLGLDAKEQGLGMSQTEQDQLRRLAEAQLLTLADGISSAIAGVAFAVGAYFPAAPVAQSIGHAANAAASVVARGLEFRERLRRPRRHHR